MIYDARSKLKDALLRKEGLTPEEVLSIFDS
jgi:hypothetical protein